MNAPSEDIKDYFETSAIGIGTLGTDLFIGKEPDDEDTPDACVTIYDTGGFESIPNYRYDYPTVQIRIRGTVGGYTGAYSKAEDIKEALHGVAGVTWNSTKYVIILAMSDILFLEYDEKNRPIFTVNFRMHRTT